MMASHSELSLECKPHFHSDQTQKLEEFVTRLEEERLKIDAFKRELPLCMQLLTNAMEASKQQLLSYRANQGAARPVLEEFIPLKHGSPEGSENAANSMSDKANWMTSAQLWSPAGDPTNKLQSTPPTTTTSSPDKETDIHISSSTSPKQRNAGAFLPFQKKENHALRPALPELVLAASTDHKEMEDKKRKMEIDNSSNNHASDKQVVVKGGISSQAAECQSTITSNTTANTCTTTTTTTTQTHRKARRCWSPDLHRRFVNALQMLGGSQVATPKQIRELMKVDGLTNDEVKSHLQKYRLHTRRPSASPQASSTATPQLVVLGGIWVPPEYAAAAHGGAPPAIYSAHPTSHASPHFCAPTVPQEFYPSPTASQPSHHHQLLHHHHHHHQLHVYKQTSQTHSSPESDARGNGGRSESIEDGKSESSSWKADSGGENGGERKGLVLREEGDESNGSEITLKF